MGLIQFPAASRYFRQLLGLGARDVDYELHQAVMPVAPIPYELAPPPERDYGTVGVQLAAAAGFRTELSFSVGLLGQDDVALIWFRPRFDGFNNLQVILNPTISGFTPIFNPTQDSRISDWAATPGNDFLILGKNTAAATATGTQQSGLTTPAAALAGYTPWEIGPYLISRLKTILIRPAADNAALAGIVRWELRRSTQ